METGLTLPTSLFKGKKFQQKLELKKLQTNLKTTLDMAMQFFVTKKSKLIQVLLPIFLKFIMMYTKLTKDKTLPENISKDNEKTKNEKEKKETSTIRKFYIKLINSRFFQKLLSFVQRIATTSFITEFLTFLILLKYGVFNFFIPILLSTLQDALLTLIHYIPTIVKFITTLLITTIPNLLKPVLMELATGIIRGILQLLGFQQKEIKDILQKLRTVLEPVITVLSKILPSLFVILYFFPKVISIITGAFTLLKIIFTGLLSIGKILLFAGKILFTIFSSTAGIVVLIIAAIVGIGYLIYKYWDEIKEFFKQLGIVMWKYIKIFGKIIWDEIKKFFKQLGQLGIVMWKYIKIFGKIIWDEIKKSFKQLGIVMWKYIKIFGKIIWKFFQNYFINPIKKIAQLFYNIFIKPLEPLFTAMSKLKSTALDKVSNIINWVTNQATKIANFFKEFLQGVTGVITDVLNYFSMMSDIGIIDWIRMDDKKKSALLARRKQIEQSDVFYKAIVNSEKLTPKEQRIVKSDTKKLNTYRELFALAQQNNVNFANLIASIVEKTVDKLDLQGKITQEQIKIVYTAQEPRYTSLTQNYGQ